MTSGRKNIDEKSGFILTEVNGRERIMVVDSMQEQNMWAKALSKAIGDSKRLKKETDSEHGSTAKNRSYNPQSSAADPSQERAIDPKKITEQVSPPISTNELECDENSKNDESSKQSVLENVDIENDERLKVPTDSSNTVGQYEAQSETLDEWNQYPRKNSIVCFLWFALMTNLYISPCSFCIVFYCCYIFIFSPCVTLPIFFLILSCACGFMIT